MVQVVARFLSVYNLDALSMCKFMLVTARERTLGNPITMTTVRRITYTNNQFKRLAQPILLTLLQAEGINTLRHLEISVTLPTVTIGITKADKCSLVGTIMNINH